MEKYTMQQLLDKYNNCGVFSLTYAPRITTIPVQDKKHLLASALGDQKKALRERYEYLKNKGEVGELDFDVVYDDVYAECLEFFKKIIDCDMTELLSSRVSPFIADHVGKDTKYSEPLSLFWHMYHNIQNTCMANGDLQELDECEQFEADKIFGANDKVLRDNLQRYEYTYMSHCTQGPLQLVLYFSVNAATKEWLCQFADDFDLQRSNFEDLALYENGKAVFSSCTHEGFNSFGYNF